MTTIPKWTEERTAQLEAAVANEDPVTKATVDRLATELETSSRSVSSKLRKLGYEVQKASEAPRAFSAEQAEELEQFVRANEGQLTYGQIAEQFSGGEFNARQIQGKILSMELTELVAATPKPETQKTYSDEDEQTIIRMATEGAFVEDIAEAVGREVQSVRGKALSLLRGGQISEMPRQREVKGQAPDAFDSLGDVSDMTVEVIAERLGKTVRGVKTMLTRRKVNAADYRGADKAAKNASATATA